MAITRRWSIPREHPEADAVIKFIKENAAELKAMYPVDPLALFQTYAKIEKEAVTQ